MKCKIAGNSLSAKRQSRAVWSLSPDSVLYEDMRYLIPILNSIEEEDEYRREREMHPIHSIADDIGDSTYGLYQLENRTSDSLVAAIRQAEEMHEMLASPTKIVSSY